MKLKNIVMVTLLALGSVAYTANAQDNNGGPPGAGGGPGEGGPGGFGGPGGEGRHHHRPPPIPLITALDTNRDGIIDAAEIANASAALLTLDKNGDGVLTTNEYLPPLPPDGPRPPLPLIVKALDANGDGVIDAAEIANARAALKALDKNGDGVLTPDEFIGKRPGHGPHGGHGPNSGNGNEAGGPPPEDGPGGPGGGGPPPGDN